MSNDTAASNPTERGAARWITALFIALGMALLAGQSKAGQYTHDQIIGFSEDGRYFAYETFGLQRGSGLPYASIYVVDLDRDAWVSGTPFEASEGEADPMGSFSLVLESITAPGGADYCYQPESLRGYRMTLQAPGAAAQTLHADQRIPASRGCPTAYRLDAVVSAGYPQESSTLVAMISVWRQGFEGQERHVISLPVPMP
ncbi:MAG: DUF2259 domain-containing protein [Loktanella sp.]|nr:DUF2259 domain-containing protein [Loktanella sp.]